MIALLLAAASITIAPPLDRPLRVVLHQERVQAGTTRRYEIERTLVFHRDETGLVAEMTLVRVWQDIGGDSGRRFEAAAGALKGRTVRFRLMADGRVAAIDDEAALWTATLAAIAAITANPKAATTLGREPATMLTALPPEQRRAILALPLTALLATDPAEAVPGSGPVTVAGDPVVRRSLPGTRTVTATRDARLSVTVHAQSGDAAHPASLDRRRVIDPPTGLVVETRETQSAGSGSDVQISREQLTIASW